MSRRRKIHQDEFIASERDLIQVGYRTYSDILFIILPFLLVALMRIWDEEATDILKYPDFSIISLILAGITLGKISITLIHDKQVAQYRAYASFAYAAIVSVIMAPSLVIITMTLSNHPMSDSVAIGQLLIFILSIALYSLSMNLSHIVSTAFATRKL